jgi:hypothetical protein
MGQGKGRWKRGWMVKDNKIKMWRKFYMSTTTNSNMSYEDSKKE